MDEIALGIQNAKQERLELLRRIEDGNEGVPIEEFRLDLEDWTITAEGRTLYIKSKSPTTYLTVIDGRAVIYHGVTAYRA
jgi:hypothetical protein